MLPQIVWTILFVLLLKYLIVWDMWAASWRNLQNDCAPSEDPDQPGHLPSLIRVFNVCSVGS